MSKLTKSLLLFLVFTFSSLAEEEKIDRISVWKAKHLFLPSQLTIKDRNTYVSVQVSGRIPIMDKLFGKGPNDDEWEEKVTVYFEQYVCSSTEQNIARKTDGFTIHGYAGDAAVVTIREAVKILKDDGAKYIVFYGPELTSDGKYGFQKNISATEVVYRMVTSKYDVSKISNSNNLRYLTMSDFGEEGSPYTFTNLHVFHGQHERCDDLNRMIASPDTFVSHAYLNISGIKSLSFFKEKLHPNLFVFPIEEVETALKRYMQIPYIEKRVDVQYRGE